MGTSLSKGAEMGKAVCGALPVLLGTGQRGLQHHGRCDESKREREATDSLIQRTQLSQTRWSVTSRPAFFAAFLGFEMVFTQLLPNALTFTLEH